MELTSDTFEYHQGLGCDVTFVRAFARIQGLEKGSYEAFLQKRGRVTWRGVWG